MQQQDHTTLRVIVEAGPHTLEGTVPAGTDFDGVFTLTENDGTKLRVHGWLCTVEVEG